MLPVVSLRYPNRNGETKPCSSSSAPVTGPVTIPAAAEPPRKIAVARPRLESGSHCVMQSMAPGKKPASATPRRMVNDLNLWTCM
ncbi:hypothetical protein EDD90_8674 [Streptomyces sp. Ag109_O5-1]|nr:hypothetical protein EDD90_8674 [Streptomyces sp. Ag109_O5-1]